MAVPATPPSPTQPAAQLGTGDLARHRETREADDLRNVWRVAGVLYIGGGVTSLPSTLLLDNDPSWIAICALTLTTIVFGFSACGPPSGASRATGSNR